MAERRDDRSPWTAWRIAEREVLERLSDMLMTPKSELRLKLLELNLWYFAGLYGGPTVAPANVRTRKCGRVGNQKVHGGIGDRTRELFLHKVHAAIGNRTLDLFVLSNNGSPFYHPPILTSNLDFCEFIGDVLMSIWEIFQQSNAYYCCASATTGPNIRICIAGTRIRCAWTCAT